MVWSSIIGKQRPSKKKRKKLKRKPPETVTQSSSSSSTSSTSRRGTSHSMPSSSSSGGNEGVVGSSSSQAGADGARNRLSFVLQPQFKNNRRLSYHQLRDLLLSVRLKSYERNHEAVRKGTGTFPPLPNVFRVDDPGVRVASTELVIGLLCASLFL